MMNCKLTKAEVVGYLIFGVLVIALFVCCTNSKSGQKEPAKSQKVAAPVEPALSKEEFIKKCTAFVYYRSKKSDKVIYVQDFLKNPDGYSGQRVNMKGKILSIEEANGKTVINAYISKEYDVGIIQYDAPLNAYKDDFIQVYGTVLGRIDGTNKMGAQMTWPAVAAKYVKVIQRGDD